MIDDVRRHGVAVGGGRHARGGPASVPTPVGSAPLAQLKLAVDGLAGRPFPTSGDAAGASFDDITVRAAAFFDNFVNAPTGLAGPCGGLNGAIRTNATLELKTIYGTESIGLCVQP